MRLLWIFKVKMKIFVSYKFTGEDREELKEIIGNICSSLEKAKHPSFCSFWKGDFFNENKFSHRQILEYALNELDKSDAILALVKSEEKSEGMLIEIGYALAKNKKFILAIKKGLKTTFIREMADEVIEFDDINDLTNKLSKIKI